MYPGFNNGADFTPDEAGSCLLVPLDKIPVDKKGRYAPFDRVTVKAVTVEQGKYMFTDFYVTTYCNFAHRVEDGKPIQHECRIIPPEALRAEMKGDVQHAIEILKAAPIRRMTRGVKR